MEIFEEVKSKAKAAKEASYKLAVVSSKDKNRVLKKMAAKIREAKEILKEKNRTDVEAGVKAGLSNAMIDRLTLNDKSIS